MLKELTLKQKNFCHYYIETGNQALAYKKAGFKATDNTAKVEGCKMMKKPEVQAYIKELMEKKENDMIASQDEVLEFLTMTMRDSSQPIAQRIKAGELLGKRYATFVDKVQQENSGEFEITIIDED